MTRGRNVRTLGCSLALAALLAPACAWAGTDEAQCGGMVSLPDGAPPRYAILSGSLAGTAGGVTPIGESTDWFDAAIPHGARGYPNAATAADLDGDGQVDLVVAGSGADSLTLFLGAADRLVETRRSVRLPGRPFDVAAGDLDGDGRPDLVCSLWDQGALAVLINAGGASFPSAVAVPAGGQTRGLALADLDLDGDLDAAVASAATNSVQVFRNRGDGTFHPAIEHVVGSAPAMLIAADADGDGLADLVTADVGCLSVSCLLNMGGGVFAPRVTSRVPTTPYGIAAGDLDGDGQLDLALSGPQRGAVLWGDGTGRFASDPSFAPPGDPDLAGVAAVDLDRDGRSEVLLVESIMTSSGDSWFDLLRVWRNPGGRRFAQGPLYRVTLYTQSLLVADLDGDGLRDITSVAAWQSRAGYPSGAAILLNRGDGTLGAMLHNRFPGSRDVDRYTRLAAVSLRPDGIMDVVAHQQAGGLHEVLLSRNQGALGFTPALPVAGGRIASVADLDRDGSSDLTTFRGDTLEVRLGQIAGDFSPVTATMRGIFHATGDFDGDGRPDLVLMDSLQCVSVAPGRGDGTFDAPRTMGVTLRSHPPGEAYGYSDRSAALDIDRDGLDDFVTDFRVAEEAYDSVVVYLNRGATGFDSVAAFELTPSEPLYLPYSSRVVAMATADVDGDGWKDVMVLSRGYYGTFVSCLLTRPGGVIEIVQGPQWWGSETSGMTLGDYDRDGRLDVIVSDDHTDDPGYMFFLRGNGDGTFEVRFDDDFGDYITSVTTGRFDADGASDIAFINQRSGSFEILFNSHRSDLPTPALASLVSAAVEDGVARIVWQVSDVPATVGVERSGDGAAWAPLATLVPDGDGRVRLDDPGVRPGRRYGWRLVLDGGAAPRPLAEAWLDIPGPAALSLAGARPNPVAGDLTVAFTLPDHAPATLALYDLAGRRLAARAVGTLGPGSHRVRLAARAELAPGLYFVRLAARGRTLVARAVVTR